MNSAFNIDAETAIELHRLMVLIRRFEEESSRLYMQGKIRGFLHLYIGQEAVAAGAIPCLRPDDYVVSHYRDHGHALAKGMDPSTVMAELCGKATGSSGGKGGSMHLFNVSKGFMGGYAIVGGQLPIAAGLAHAIKYREEDRVVLCFFGDGAVNEGEFHETINLAAVWKLPILFFLENNLYGMGTHVEKTHALGKDIYAERGCLWRTCSPDRRHGPDRCQRYDHDGSRPNQVRQRSRLRRSDDLQVPRPLDCRPFQLPGL